MSGFGPGASNSSAIVTDLATIEASNAAIEASNAAIEASNAAIEASTTAIEDRAVTIPAGTTSVAEKFVTALTAHVASQALPAAGAFTSQALETIPDGAKQIIFWISFTRGSAASSARFRAEFSPDDANGYRTSVLNDASFYTAGQEGNIEFYTESVEGPVPDSASATRYILAFKVPSGASSFRLLAAELGDTANPGTIAIDYVAEG